MNVRKNETENPEPKRLFEMSTQFRHWRFSESGLGVARKELNEGAVRRVKIKLEEERNVDSDQATEEPSQIEYLTAQDEVELVTFYLTKISQLCRASFFRFPESVEATAMTYLKRFYLRNTSTKTENISISIDNFATRIPKTTNDDVLALEFLVAQSLRFQFKVHHAHLAARGVYLDVQHACSADPNKSSESWVSVCSLLRAARLTDAEFLWTPSQIATAAWWKTDRSLTESWLKAKSDRCQPSWGLDELLKELNSIVKLITAAQVNPIDKDRVTAVDRRLRLCSNPEKDPSSTLYQRRQAELESQSIARQREKNIRGRPLDPFA